jgi:ATP-dependent helicase/nuclease subunit A
MPEHVLPVPPDQAQRERALDPACSVMVQAPAGSGKTDLLTRRFLRLLGEVDDPTQIVAITFTRAAAAEMRNRILAELERAALAPPVQSGDESSLEVLSARALERSRRLGWNLLELSSQLRISTIDSFCAEIAARQPLLSSLGSALRISENPDALYRRAAHTTLMQLDADDRHKDADLTGAIAVLLDWRDNNWQEIEEHLAQMLRDRDRWMQDFVLTREQDWVRLRERLERPFARAIHTALSRVDRLLATVPGAYAEAMALARFACANHEDGLHRELAEMADFPSGPWPSPEELEDARHGFACLARMVMKDDGEIREAVNKQHGFPSGARSEKARLLAFAQDLFRVPGLRDALHAIRKLPPLHYTDDEWRIVRAAFTLLHHAAGELHVALAEAGVADFVEVAQAARRVLQNEDKQPTDAAMAIADEIRHLLVDEFQDTSRRQHQLLSALVSAWPEPAGRTLFVVGDPMQSIYFFRDADAELFARVQSIGLELAEDEPHRLGDVRLTSNFRTAPQLVTALNEMFHAAFAEDDNSGIHFGPSEPARPADNSAGARIALHTDFVPRLPQRRNGGPDSEDDRQDLVEEHDQSAAAQTGELVELIQRHFARAAQARAGGRKYRIAVLGRTRASLTPIALELRRQRIPFRAVELEPLAMQPEVLDALALARALYFPEDRVAWLGVLRAPWCGLSLNDLHAICGDDSRRPILDLLRERAHLLSKEGRAASARLLHAFDAAPALRSALPASALGTWLEQVWRSFGGAACVDAQARNNLDMLWQCLDRLPGGEPDLLGRGLDAALKQLNAQPDPAAEGDCGVQLMTIHKSKGLEFEVVIVPDLHARTRTTTFQMLSWLERGLVEADDADEITEFLIAPFQTKGGDRGGAKAWVDGERRRRERQEMRRVFYVAATRAREELHLFTRLHFKSETGELCHPPDSLLQVAWPALEPQIREQFAKWQADREEPQVAEIAASGNNVVEMPQPAKYAILRRLPADFKPLERSRQSTAQRLVANNGGALLFTRHQGGMESRALGAAVHSFLEEIARHRAAGIEASKSGPALRAFLSRVSAQVRALGMDPGAAERLAARALELALRAARDPIGNWILSPHPDSASEVRWTGIVNGAIHSVQVDRVFRAGALPQAEGADAWWIIDYKSAHPDASDPADSLPRLRELFSPQLAIYAEVLRGLHGRDVAIRAGLYYPRLPAFDWWEP